MSDRHQLHAFNYINRPYSEIRRDLLERPLRIFRAATTATDKTGPELHVKAGPVDVSAEIEMEILSISEADAPRPTTTVEVAWRAKHRAPLFPTLRATISMYPLTPTETQLELSGVYDPPLGLLGEALDAIAMRDFARISVQGFIDDTAAYLRSMASG